MGYVHGDWVEIAKRTSDVELSFCFQSSELCIHKYIYIYT